MKCPECKHDIGNPSKSLTKTLVSGTPEWYEFRFFKQAMYIASCPYCDVKVHYDARSLLILYLSILLLLVTPYIGDAFFEYGYEILGIVIGFVLFLFAMFGLINFMLFRKLVANEKQ